ncbi:hypothetical protein BST96_16180 [Oceanicoccus sagamiensis]|uniref:methylated-DNA--[protein]-cysteine S-methyltransferase n=2 Tax=Oceanicoccus sagamiensis TaxID=716816 RepID=A0A1X9NBV3_9GAMM|nr:hypothetical protein BST96_16180 [Oceanicoccus sagamiensis]
MHDICRYIETHHQQRLTLAVLAEQAGMSPAHFQKLFKKTIGVSPRQYQERCRIQQFKQSLKAGDSVTAAIQNTGYESTSRIYEKLDSHIGMTPNRYKKGGAGETISYASTLTAIGTAMIAATDRGICFLQLDECDALLLQRLKQEFPNAELQSIHASTQPLFDQWMQQLKVFLEGKVEVLDLPLDIIGTAFQHMVWQYLTTIPAGDLQSYTEVARGLGRPNSVRAVASACANNKIAIAIPCHRVIRGDGSLAGYKWGLSRKRRLIDLESSAIKKGE